MVNSETESSEDEIDEIAVHDNKQTLTLHTATLIERYYWPVFIGAFLGFVVSVIVCRELLHLIPPPVIPLIVSALSGAVLVAMIWLGSKTWNRLVIDEDARTLTLIDRRDGMITVPCDSIEAIVGQSGLSADGGELIRWRSTRIVWSADDQRLQTEASSEHTYFLLLRQCPNAVGISYHDEIHYPNALSTASIVSSGQLARIRTLLARLAQRHLLPGVLLFIGALISFGVAIAGQRAREVDDDAFAKLTVFCVVAIGLGVTGCTRGLRLLRRAKQVENAIGSIRPSSVSTPTDPRAPRHRRIGFSAGERGSIR